MNKSASPGGRSLLIQIKHDIQNNNHQAMHLVYVFIRIEIDDMSWVIESCVYVYIYIQYTHHCIACSVQYLGCHFE